MKLQPEERIHTEAVLHRIALHRYSTSLVRKMVGQINRTQKSVLARLQEAAGSNFSGRRLEALLASLRSLEAQGWATLKLRFETELAGLVGAELEFHQKLLAYAADAVEVDVTWSSPTVNQVMAAVKARPFQGRLLKDWLSEAEEASARRTREVIRQGYIEGATVDDMVRRLAGSKVSGYRDGVLEISRRGVEAMVRTAVTHTSNVGSQELYKSAGALVVGWEFVATLDSRTSLTCATLDGKVFPIGKGPQPPRHINCRSVTIPRIRGMRRTPRTTYADWLKKQPPQVQDEVLGVAKAALFRTGNLTVDRFTDTTGKVLNLEELKAKNAGAFSAVDEAARQTIKTFDAADFRAIADYTGSGYRRINGFLRGEVEGTPDLQRRVAALDRALAKSRLAEDVLVERGVIGAYARKLAESNLRPGSIIKEPGYLSTSKEGAVARNFGEGSDGVLMVVYARKGQRGLDVSTVSSVKSESEILFGRGSRLKVVEWNRETRTLTVERLADRS
jgi:SPP1 gp7 family putative phage head morphogenesis protein